MVLDSSTEDDVASSQPPVESAAVTESTPLLAESHERVKATPLPVAQLLVLATVRLAEPISFSQVSSSVWNSAFLCGLTDATFACRYSLTSTK